MSSSPADRSRATVLRAAAPSGPGWVHATVARRRYRRRLWWVRYDLAMHAEDRTYILLRGWRFIGRGPSGPLCEIVAEGWIPRPHGP